MLSTLLIATLAIAGKVVEPTPELQSAIEKMTNAKIVQVETGRSKLTATYEVEFDSSAAGVSEIEVSQKDLSLIEAEGRSLTSNTFTPGQDLKPLTELAAAVEKYQGFSPQKWELEKKLGKWVYKVKGLEGNVEKEYHFDAKDLTLIKSKIDD